MLHLSTIEQSGPRGYIRPLYFFDLGENYSKENVTAILQKCLAETKSAIPLLSAELVKDTESEQKGRLHLRQGDCGHLFVKDLRNNEKFPWTYATLQENNFPTYALPGDLLCPWGVFPHPDEAAPVFGAQANFVEGGMILSILIMHSTADARAIHEILNIWAQNCALAQRGGEESPTTSLDPIIFEKEIMSQGLDDGVEPRQHPEFLVAPAPGPPPAAMLKDTFRTKVYYISPEDLARLKLDGSANRIDSDSWISTNDAVSALIWRSVVAAQVDPSKMEEESLNTICVDGRQRCSPPLSPHHIGCPMVYATPRFKVGEMVHAESIAELALTVRKAINSVDAEYIDSVVSFLNSAPDFGCVVPATFLGLMDNSVMMTAWQKVPMYDINWGPALGGHCKSIRTVSEGFFNGSSVVLPFLSNGGIEIVIGLDEANFEKFDQDKLWNKYAVARCP